MIPKTRYDNVSKYNAKTFPGYILTQNNKVFWQHHFSTPHRATKLSVECYKKFIDNYYFLFMKLDDKCPKLLYIYWLSKSSAFSTLVSEGQIVLRNCSLYHFSLQDGCRFYQILIIFVHLRPGKKLACFDKACHTEILISGYLNEPLYI